MRSAARTVGSTVKGAAIGATVLVLLICAGTASPVQAAEFLFHVGDQVLSAGTTVHEDAVVTAGTLLILGTVDGDATAIGGSVSVAGHVTGSVRAIGGNVLLYPTAVVDGQASAWGGHLEVAPGARVGGVPFPPTSPAPSPPAPAVPLPPVPGVPMLPYLGPVPEVPGPLNPPTRGPIPWWWPPALFGIIAGVKVLSWLAVTSLLACFVGLMWLTAALFPGPVMRLADVLERAPGAALGLGLAVWALSVPTVMFLAFTIVGLPVIFLVPLVLLTMHLFGTVAIALVLGRRLRPSGMSIEVLVGAVVLALAFAIPHLGWMAILIAAAWGVGTVPLALFGPRGERPSPPSGPSSSVAGRPPGAHEPRGAGEPAGLGDFGS
jgi:hypothetical protein